MYQSIRKFLILLVLTTPLSSCVRDTDFDQFDQTLLTPVLDLNLIFWEVEATRFNSVASNLPLGQVSDTTEIRILDDAGTRRSVVRADFLFEFENTTDSDYGLVIDFLSLLDERVLTSFLIDLFMLDFVFNSLVLDPSTMFLLEVRNCRVFMSNDFSFVSTAWCCVAILLDSCDLFVINLRKRKC